MPKRLEAQLEEAQASLRQYQAQLDELKKTHAAAIEAAQQRHDAADKAQSAVYKRCTEMEKKVEVENKITYANGKWHPDFLDRVAAAIGVHYKEREKVDPKNQYNSLYEQALSSLRSKLVDEHPAIKKLNREYEKASDAYSDARSALWDAERPLGEAERLVAKAKREVDELQRRIKDRELEKATGPVPGTAEARAAAEAEEKLKAARAKLKAITTLGIKLEPTK